MIRILGHEFNPMDQNDWYAYAGADEGSYISYPTENLVLIWSPNAKILSEIVYSDDGCNQKDWTFTEILK